MTFPTERLWICSFISKYLIFAEHLHLMIVKYKYDLGDFKKRFWPVLYPVVFANAGSCSKDPFQYYNWLPNFDFIKMMLNAVRRKKVFCTFAFPLLKELIVWRWRHYCFIQVQNLFGSWWRSKMSWFFTKIGCFLKLNRSETIVSHSFFTNIFMSKHSVLLCLGLVKNEKTVRDYSAHRSEYDEPKRFSRNLHH